MAQPINGYTERLETSPTTTSEISASPSRRIYSLPGIIEVDGTIRLEGVEYAEPGESWEIGGKEFQAIAFGVPHDPEEELPPKTKSSHGSIEEEMRLAHGYMPAKLKTFGYGILRAHANSESAYSTRFSEEQSTAFIPDPRNRHHEPGLRI